MALQRKMLFLHKKHTFHHKIIHHKKFYINVKKINKTKQNYIQDLLQTDTIFPSIIHEIPLFHRLTRQSLMKFYILHNKTV